MSRKTKATDPKKATRTPAKKAAPVTVTNILDGVPPALHKTIREHARGDLRRVRVVNGIVEIDIT